MIETKRYTRHVFVCDECGWRGDPERTKEAAQRDGDTHSSRCGQHGEEYDSTGGYRGILGGYNRRCICGARYISELGEPFACPKDAEAKAAPAKTEPGSAEEPTSGDQT